MIDNPKTFNDLREALKAERDLMYYQFDKLEKTRSQVDELINTIQEMYDEIKSGVRI